MKRIAVTTYAMFSLMLFCADYSGSEVPEGVLLYYIATGINLIYSVRKVIGLQP